MALTKNPNAKYQQLFDLARRSRLPYDKEAWLNVSFYLGEQYVEWASETASLRRIPRPDNHRHTPRPVANKIMHFVNQEHAMTLQSRPTVDVMPATDDPMDITDSNVAQAYLQWLADAQNCDFDSVLADAVMWALAATEGYMKWTWSARDSRGEICAVSPFDIYPDPYVTRFKDCRYIFHSRFMDVEQVYDIYGVEIKPTNQEKADPVKVAMMREMGMAPVLTGAIVTELWYKPSRRHPQGLYTVWAGNDTLVPPSPFPYEHRHLPFTQIGSIQRPGSAHYTSAVSFLRTPQMELNKFHAQMIQVREAFANPKWWVPAELELESDPDDSPRQILRGNSNNGMLKPEILQPSQMPPNDQGAWISTEMMDVVGLHEVSQAQVPGRVEAAQAIQLLKESDDSRLAELLRTITSSISEGYWQQLQLAKQYMSAEQIVQTYSREGLPEVQRFKAEQIKPGMKIRVTSGTGLSRSRAARTDQLMTLWQNQIIKDPEMMAELLDLPISTVGPASAFDLRLARNENLRIAADIAITPNSWDNHDIHKREHNSYRKTQEYAELSDQVKAKFEYHVNMHDQLEIQQLGKQLQIQQMAAAVASGAGFQAPPPGAAGPPGPASGGGDAPAGPIPAAAGANPPADPNAVRDSPQGQAYYQQREEANLHRPRE